MLCLELCTDQYEMLNALLRTLHRSSFKYKVLNVLFRTLHRLSYEYDILNALLKTLHRSSYEYEILNALLRILHRSSYDYDVLNTLLRALHRSTSRNDSRFKSNRSIRFLFSIRNESNRLSRNQIIDYQFDSISNRLQSIKIDSQFVLVKKFYVFFPFAINAIILRLHL